MSKRTEVRRTLKPRQKWLRKKKIPLKTITGTRARYTENIPIYTQILKERSIYSISIVKLVFRVLHSGELCGEQYSRRTMRR